MPVKYVTCVCGGRAADSDKQKERHLNSRSHCKNLRKKYVEFTRKERVRFFTAFYELESEDELFKTFCAKDVSFNAAIDRFDAIDILQHQEEYERRHGDWFPMKYYEPIEYCFDNFFE